MTGVCVLIVFMIYRSPYRVSGQTVSDPDLDLLCVDADALSHTDQRRWRETFRLNIKVVYGHYNKGSGGEMVHETKPKDDRDLVKFYSKFFSSVPKEMNIEEDCETR